MLSLLITAFLAYFAYYQLYGKRKGLPPGPTPWPIVGNLLQLDQKHPDKTIIEWGKKYGPVFTAWLPGVFVIVNDHKLLKDTFIKQGELYTGRPSLPINNDLFKGNGIFFAEGPIWKANRKFLVQVLHDFGLGRNTLEPHIMDQARELVSYLHKTTTPIDIRNPLLAAVGNVMNLLVFGYASKFDDPKLSRFKDIFEEYSSVYSSFSGMLLELFPWIRHLDPKIVNFGYWKLMNNYKQIFEFIAGEIKQHKEKRTLTADQLPNDFTDAYLLEISKRAKAGDSDHFSEWQMIVTILDLWAAGFEAPVTTLQFAVLFLLNNPTAQEKLHEEMDRVVGSEHELTMDDQNRLPYLCATVQELQRTANVVPLNLQRTVNEDTMISGFRIPKNTIVIPQTTCLHLDPEVFIDPDHFRPERFIDATGQFIRSKHVMPFSIGKRACVGEHLAHMELFLILGTLMQHCEFRSIENGKPPPIDYLPGLIRSPAPFLCKIMRRRA